MTKLIAVTPENDSIRERFFRAVFGEYTGVVAFFRKASLEDFGNEFFRYPEQLPEMLAWINANYLGSNLYFCSQLLDSNTRKKPNVVITPNLWADLDEVDPETCDPRPSIAVQSSEGHWQGFWLLDDPGTPQEVEQANLRLTYKLGADKSGWDLTQLLRVPLTYNYKRDADNPDMVRVLWLEEDNRLSMDDLTGFPDPPQGDTMLQAFEQEAIDALPDAEDIIIAYRMKLPNSFSKMYTNTQVDDRSSVMWALESICLEAGMTREETFKVVEAAPINKYKQDKRDANDLWKEVIKAHEAIKVRIEYAATFELDELLTDKEKQRVSKLPPTFVEDYVTWAITRTDAAVGYHEAGAFIILSSLLSESLELPMSFGKVRPNLWFMILGDTTLTRKTTAMEMAMDTLNLVYEDALLATDGSVEGIMQALSQRAGRTSLFVRDEISGLVNAMQKKDYLSGLVEGFSRWYEGKNDVRVLKKERIEIRNPRFIMFCGGIKSRMMELLDREYIINGFVPRFLFITAVADFDTYRAPTMMLPQMQEVSTDLLTFLSKLKDKYDQSITIRIGGQDITAPAETEVDMTDDALARYAEFEKQMAMGGALATEPELYSPTLDRMAKSGLKIAMIFAAIRDIDAEKVVINLDDMLRAISYINRWKGFTLEVIDNAGKGSNERQLERAFTLVKKGKETRSDIMRSMHLTAKEADWIVETLEQRGLITTAKHGKMQKLYATSI